MQSEGNVMAWACMANSGTDSPLSSEDRKDFKWLRHWTVLQEVPGSNPITVKRDS